MKKNKYIYIIIIGWALWIGETWYFGWNDKPINNIEKTLDILSTFLILWGVIGDLTKNVTIQKNILK